MTFSTMSRKECSCSFLLRFVPSSFCMKKRSFLLPFSLPPFHLPCALNSDPIGELGGFTKPLKCNKEYLLDKSSLSNCWTFARKNETKTSAEHRGCKRCHWQDRILLSSAFFLSRLNRKQLEEGKSRRTGTVLAEPHRRNSGANKRTTTVVRSKEKRAEERAAGTTPQSSALSRELPRSTLATRARSQVRGTRQGRHSPLGIAPCPSAASAAVGDTARCLFCPLLYLPAASPARAVPAGAAPRARAAPGGSRRGHARSGGRAGSGRSGAERGAGRPPHPRLCARRPGLPPGAQRAPGNLKALSQL